MNINFNRFFWGFIVIFLDIRIIFIDVLPDPVGYFLLYTGLRRVLIASIQAKRVKMLAMALTNLSIPAAFYQPDIGLNEMSQMKGISPWFVYTSTMEILHLILVFFIFKLIVEVVTSLGDEALIKRSSGIFTVYMTCMLLFTFFHTFLLNIPNDIMVGILVFTILITIVLEILFLALLRKLDKYESPQETF